MRERRVEAFRYFEKEIERLKGSSMPRIFFVFLYFLLFIVISIKS